MPLLQPALITTAQTETKCKLPVPDEETRPRRDELGTGDGEKQQLLHGV